MSILLKRSKQSNRKCSICQQIFSENGFYHKEDRYCRKCRNHYTKLTRHCKLFFHALNYWQSLENNTTYRHLVVDGLNEFRISSSLPPEQIPITTYALLARIPKYHQKQYALAFYFLYVFPSPQTDYTTLLPWEQNVFTELYKNIFSINYGKIELLSLTMDRICDSVGPSLNYLHSSKCNLGTLPKWITYEKQCKVCGMTKPTFTLEDIYPADLSSAPQAYSLFLRKLANSSTRSNPGNVRTLGFNGSQYSNDGWKQSCKNCKKALATDAAI